MNGLKEEMILQDKIEYIGNHSLIQHGKHNNRIYLMKMSETDFPQIISDINNIARDNEYTKIFCKLPSWAAPHFLSDGFFTEAIIPLLFKGKVDGFFMSKILNSDRFLELETSKLKEFSVVLNEMKLNKSHVLDSNHKFMIKELLDNNIEEIAIIYRKVFESYPFPIHSEGYLKKIMNENVCFFGAFHEYELIGVSSAEYDEENQCVEMTDFAVLPEYRGNNLATMLLREMELTMSCSGMKTMYTIARLNSIAMNKTFLKSGYSYGGTLIKNTNISGSIESMNVLYKNIKSDE